MNFIETEQTYTSGVYGKRDVCFVEGRASTLWDDQNNEYLDFGAGIAVAVLGHSHPVLVDAIRQQAGFLITSPELAYNDRRAELLECLVGILPSNINRAFLCNSGAEAVEAAIKFARLSTGRPNIVATMRGFHGRTMGALSATHKAKYRKPFGPLVPGFSHVPFNNIDKMAAAITPETAAVIVEIVQGEGGVRMGSAEYFTQLRQLCDQNDTLLIVDEVQTGFGRTGAWFASNHFNLQPDLICLGKAIAGGVPMGAVGIGTSVSDLPVGCHGSTFGGNPLACAAALATIGTIEHDGLVGRSAELGIYFRERLEAIHSPLIRQVRGRGLMIGVEMKVRVGPIVRELLTAGFLVLNAGPTVLRFLPPLIIGRDEINRVCESLDAILTKMSQSEATI